MARHRPLSSLASQQQLLERLTHLVQLSSQTIFISGVAGAGKSSLASQLLAAPASSAKVCQLTCQPKQSVQQQRNLLLSQLVDEPLFDPADPFPDSAMRMLGEGAQSCLLVIDDAQLLDAALLAELTAWMLANRQRALPHHLNILFLGEPDWSSHALPLVRSRLGAEQAIEIEIPGLTEADIQQLVRWYYRQAGIETPFPNVEAVERQLDLLSVTPAMVLAATEHCLRPPPPDTDKADRGQRYRRIGWLVVLLATLGVLLSWGYQPLLRQWQHISGELARFTPEQEAARRDAPVPEVAVAPGDQTISGADGPQPEPLAGSWPAAVSSAALPDLLSGAVTTLDSPESASERVVLPDEVLRMLIRHQQRREQQAGAPQASQLPPSTTESQAPETEPAAVPLSADQGSDPAAPLAQPQSAAENADTEATFRQADGVSVPFEEWSLTPAALLRQKPVDHYTLQLAGVAEPAHLERFLREHQLQQRAWTYLTRRNGEPWYVVILGDYPNAERASEALQRLPDSLQAQSPWIKSFKQVHRELH